VSQGGEVPRPGDHLQVIEGGAEHLLDVRAVAKRLGVSRAMVYALCERGQLRHVRIGNLIRFRPADVVAYVKG
jgi:excisionase family DNA binding protein